MPFKNKFTAVTFGCFALCNIAQASELDLRISDDTVEANYAVTSHETDAMFGIGYLYKDDRDKINVLNIDLHTSGQTALANLPTTVGIGIQANVFKQDEFKGSAIGIGGSVRVNIPDVPGISVESELHYAPNVLTFNDADDFSRFRVQLNYRIIQSADISFGYRYLNAGVENGGDTTLESGAFLGMKLEF